MAATLTVTDNCPTLTFTDTTPYGGVYAGITTRNLALYAPDGSIIDLGGVSQVSEYTLDDSSYTVGAVFTLDFCGEEIEYTVVTGRTSRACIIADIVAAINASENEYWIKVTAEAGTTSFTITADEPGIPFLITFAVDSGSVSDELLVLSESTMTLPSGVSVNTVDYDPAEAGGQYRAVFTLISTCDYDVYDLYFYNWCYSLDQLDCCLSNLLLSSYQSECKSCKENKFKDATNLRNYIQIANDSKEIVGAGAKVQAIIDMANNICIENNACNGC
jgi:hypothetical protein